MHLKLVTEYTVLFLSLITFSLGKSTTLKNIELLQNDAIYDTFKYNLIRYYGISEDFAEQFKQNLKKAVSIELNQLNLRQGPLEEEEEDEDEITTTPTTTPGPSAFNIVNGIYGILSGVGTLNPDRAFSSAVNFFPPSQKETAQALIDSALGRKPKLPTPTTTIPTTTNATTTPKDIDEDYDEYDDETTTAAAAVVTQAATIAPPIEKYTIKPKDPVEAAPAVTSAPALSLSGSTPQDDEVETEKRPYVG